MRITSKGQVTIPKEVREKVGLHPGDVVVYDVGKDTITIRRAKRPLSKDYYRLLDETLSKTGWYSSDDDKMFRDP